MLPSTKCLHTRRLELSLLFKVNFLLWYIYECALSIKYSYIVIIVLICFVVVMGCLLIVFLNPYICSYLH